MSYNEGVSSTPIGTYTIPEPPEDTYPSTLPPGIDSPSSNTSSSSNSSSSGGSSSSDSATSTTPAENPYQAAYATLMSMDTQELLDVSFGTQENAQSNVLSVLSQWAALQADGYGASSAGSSAVVDQQA